MSAAEPPEPDDPPAWGASCTSNDPDDSEDPYQVNASGEVSSGSDKTDNLNSVGSRSYDISELSDGHRSLQFLSFPNEIHLLILTYLPNPRTLVDLISASPLHLQLWNRYSAHIISQHSEDRLLWEHARQLKVYSSRDTYYSESSWDTSVAVFTQYRNSGMRIHLQNCWTYQYVKDELSWREFLGARQGGLEEERMARCKSLRGIIRQTEHCSEDYHKMKSNETGSVAWKRFRNCQYCRNTNHRGPLHLQHCDTKRKVIGVPLPESERILMAARSATRGIDHQGYLRGR